MGGDAAETTTCLPTVGRLDEEVCAPPVAQTRGPKRGKTAAAPGVQEGGPPAPRCGGGRRKRSTAAATAAAAAAATDEEEEEEEELTAAPRRRRTTSKTKAPRGRAVAADRRTDEAGQTVKRRPTASRAVQERMQRALPGAGGHRMFLINRVPLREAGDEGGAAEQFAVLGATGNGGWAVRCGVDNRQAHRYLSCCVLSSLIGLPLPPPPPRTPPLLLQCTRPPSAGTRAAPAPTLSSGAPRCRASTSCL